MRDYNSVECLLNIVSRRQQRTAHWTSAYLAGINHTPKPHPYTQYEGGVDS